MDIARIPLEKGTTKQRPNRIVIHAMAEYLKGEIDKHAVDFLRDIGLSAHILIAPSGVIIQCRQDSQGAYHAKNYNQDSLGIEFLVSGVHDYSSFIEAIKYPYLTKPQYEAGIKVVRGWVKLHNITKIHRHSTLDPDRKKDPGDGFPWAQFINEVTA